MLRAVRLGLIAASCLVALTACGWTGTGQVQKHTFSDGFPLTTMSCSGSGSSMTCTPVITWIPETYALTVRDDKGEDHEISVNKDYFEQVQDGSTITVKE